MLPLIAIVATVIIALLASEIGPGSRSPLWRRSLFVLTAVLSMWAISIIILVFLGLDFWDATYWVITLGLGAEPLRNPPTKGVIHGILLADSAAGVLVLAIVISIVAEHFIWKAMEAAQGLNTDASNLENHIVFVGWTKASRHALHELRRHIGDIPFVVVDEKEKSAVVNQHKPDKFIGYGPLSEEGLKRANIWKAMAIIVSLDDDSKTIQAVLNIIHVLKERKKDIIDPPPKIIAEILKDENKALLEALRSKAIIDGKRIEIKVVISRSLIGRLMYSAITEPGVLALMNDATSQEYGLTAFTITTASKDGLADASVGDIVSTVLEAEDPFKRYLPVAVIRRGNEGYIKNPSLDLKLSEGDRIITMSFTHDAYRKLRNEYKGKCIEIGDNGHRNVGCFIENYQWFSEGSLQAINRVSLKGGHILLIGWTEASESFVEEVRTSSTYAHALSKLSSRYGMNKTIIMITKELNKTIPGDIVVIEGDPTSITTLKRAGALTADIIVVSLESDHLTTHVLLRLAKMLAESRRMSSNNYPLIIAETEDDYTARLLLDNRLAHIAIPSRNFSGRLIAYAALKFDVYDVVSDVTSGEEGDIDLVEVVVSSQLLKEISDFIKERKIYVGAPRFIDALDYLKLSIDIMPLAIVRNDDDTGKGVMIYMPHKDTELREGDVLVSLAKAWHTNQLYKTSQ